MGMYLELAAIRDTTIARLHADPVLVWQLLAPDDPDAVARARRVVARPGLFARLFGRAAPPQREPPPELLVLDPCEGILVSLDKAWHGLHFLLTGTAWDGEPPLNFLLAGGHELAGEGVPDTPPRTFTAAETQNIAAALEQVSAQELRDRFDPKVMMALAIYPEIWDRTPHAGDDPLAYLMDALTDLRAAVATAMQHGVGLLVVIE